MKNVHLLPTDRPSRLRIEDNGNFVFGMIQTSIQSKNDDFTNQHIYITFDASDEEIKKGDWIIDLTNNVAITEYGSSELDPGCKKIILTTDQDLIKDGVQAIDDEFLEWFVKNPSCESVEIENKKVLVGWEPDYTYEDLGIDGSKNVYHNFYKIIIPKEEPKQELPQLGTKEFNDLASAYFGGEPKQETLEEAAEKLYLSHENNELLYGHSEDLQLAYKAGILDGAKWQAERIPSIIEEYLETAFISKEQGYMNPQKWFEQFKKK
jgi:hypothetical protein